MNQFCDFSFLPTPQGQVVRIAGMFRSLATILDVVIGAGDHEIKRFYYWKRRWRTLAGT